MNGTAIHTFGRGSEVLHRPLPYLVLYGNAERKRPAAKAATMEGDGERGSRPKLSNPPRQMSRNDEVKTSAGASERAAGTGKPQSRTTTGTRRGRELPSLACLLALTAAAAEQERQIANFREEMSLKSVS